MTMADEILDDDGYPTEEALVKIKHWDNKDLQGLMEFIHPMWRFRDDGFWRQEGETYYLSTGGWSGNEEIIAALKEKRVFWMFYWQSSTRGGHHVFCPIKSL